MLAPSIFGENLFDDWFNFPEFDNFSNRAERKLYGHHADKLMKTDVRENDEGYEIDIDLPGFKKEDITLDLNNGYLTISAAKGLDNEKTNKKGRIIRQERYAGAMQRSFYVGDQYEAGDFNASFDNGELNITIPKKDAYIEDHSSRIPIE